jgi:hypothetical protein
VEVFRYVDESLAPEKSFVDLRKMAEGSVAVKGFAADKERTRSLAAPSIEIRDDLECTSLKEAGLVATYLDGSESLNRVAGVGLLVMPSTPELVFSVGATEDRPPFRNHDRTEEEPSDRSRPWLAFRCDKSLEFFTILVCKICTNARWLDELGSILGGDIASMKLRQRLISRSKKIKREAGK